MMIYFDLLKIVFRLTKNDHEDERADWDRKASAIFCPLGDASDLKRTKRNTDRRDLHKKKRTFKTLHFAQTLFAQKWILFYEVKL